MRRTLSHVFLVLMCLSPFGAALAEGAGSSNDEDARTRPALQALNEGRVEDVGPLLQPTLAANPTDGYAHQLLCRAYYAQERVDEAIRECESAAAAPQQANELASDNQLWLGRAYGMKAERAGPISGFVLARRVRACFAKALELDPTSVEAFNDLGEYYVFAPAIVGGGVDKAQALAKSSMSRFPGKAHLLLARIAVQQKDKTTAEAEFKQVIAIDKSVEASVDLASFYEANDRKDDAVAAIKSGLTVDRAHGPALVDAASILTKAHREPALEERCLRQYLASKAKTDEAPVFKVRLQLSKLLLAEGMVDEANKEAQAAAAMAPGYAHASRPRQGL